MISLNNSDGLWTSLSAKEVDLSDYQAACCLNIKISKQATANEAAVAIDDKSVPLDVLRHVVNRADQSKDAAHNVEEEVKVKAPKP